jgi:transposase
MYNRIGDEAKRYMLEALKASGGQIRSAAKAAGVPYGTFYGRLNGLKNDGYLSKDCVVTSKGDAFISDSAEIEFPDLEDDRPSTEEYLELRRKTFERKFNAKKSREWFQLKVKENKPIGICWFGDPHVDSDGCNWPLLEEHAGICAETPGMYGASLGDVTDNWVGRLTRLYAHSEQSRASAIQGAEIFISKLGIRWLLLIRGNHDMWSGNKRNDPLAWMKRGPAPMEDWQAQFELAFPNGVKHPIHASHHFAGHSWFHPMHGQIRQTLEDGRAELLVSGHTHEFGMMKIAMPKRGTLHWLGKARGYKFIDPHADIHGYGSFDEGASLVSVHNPHATTKAGRLKLFDDVAEAAEFLTFLRSK